VHAERDTTPQPASTTSNDAFQRLDALARNLLRSEAVASDLFDAGIDLVGRIETSAAGTNDEGRRVFPVSATGMRSAELDVSPPAPDGSQQYQFSFRWDAYLPPFENRPIDAALSLVFGLDAERDSLVYAIGLVELFHPLDKEAARVVTSSPAGAVIGAALRVTPDKTTWMPIIASIIGSDGKRANWQKHFGERMPRELASLAVPEAEAIVYLLDEL